MDAQHTTIEEPATPEFILAVLRDEHRQLSEIDDAIDSHALLSFESTVAEWREACDLLEWCELGRAYNTWWGVNCSDAEWRAILEPASKRRLAGVCEFIAKQTVRKRIRAASILGTYCETAGAFLTVRSLLHDAGACVDDLAPSTPLEPFARRHFQVFLGPISRLAPGSLPLVRIDPPVIVRAPTGLILGILCLFVGLLSGAQLLIFLAALLILLSRLSSWLTPAAEPDSVEIGDLKTFRDLSVVLARAARAP